MAASSHVFEDIETRYRLASTVNVSNFVSVKLSQWSSDYKIWKAQMLNVLESCRLLHIINVDDSIAVDKLVLMEIETISPFDKLVKAWIVSTLHESMLNDVQDLGTAREVWMKLESILVPPTRDTEEGHPAQKQDEEYRWALCVNVSDYVSVKLSGHNNYDIWKAQMLCLIEHENLFHIIIAKYPFPEGKGVHMIPQYDKLVKGWIFTTMHHQLLKDFLDHSSVQSIWRELESRFNRPISIGEDDSLDVSALREELKYIQVSNVHLSNFVSVKLSGKSNYRIWKAQMKCLLKSQDLLHIVEVKTRFPWNGGHMTEKYDNLVKGWIFGTMNDQLLEIFTEYNSVQLLWRGLKSKFVSPKIDTIEDSVECVFGKESAIRDVPEMEVTDNIRLKEELYEAAADGCWWKAKSTLKDHNTAATEAIAENGNTMLHVAVEMGHNYFVENLLEFIEDPKDIEMQNDKGQTALHIAALVDNEYAAHLLVKKRKELLVILDHKDESPLLSSFSNANLNVSLNLLKFVKLAMSPSCLDIYTDIFQENVASATIAAIYTKQYDVAEVFLKTYPELACRDHQILLKMAITFPTDLGLSESFIYPSFHNVLQKTVERGSLLFHSNFFDRFADDILRLVKICNNTLGDNSMAILVPVATLYPVYQLICLLTMVLSLAFSMLYLFLWKVLAVTLRPIKDIEKKKKMYKEAKKILSLICNQTAKSNYFYGESFEEAVRRDVYEVVDEILYMSPDLINYKNEDGHNIIQMAIINRSEKVYNLIYHIIKRHKSYRTMTDSSSNNLAHLAGRLAPSFVLGRPIWPALQLQRELLWRAEVNKIMLPLDLTKYNIYNETPEMVFIRERQDLMKQGEAWMKTTAESCSIIAALVVTVVFAAAITVPGGTNQESGIPVLNKEIAFTTFAISNAFSLFTAATALLLFLSILTARFSEKDFLTVLPRRLIFGLVSLFLSTTAMIVAFGATLFLVFCDRRPWMLAPIFGFACLPISVMVTVKLPLLVDFIQSTYFPILGDQSSVEPCKINQKTTIFMV